MPAAPRLAVIGHRGALDLCVGEDTDGIHGVSTADGDVGSALARLEADVIVVLDPEPGSEELLAAAPSAVSVAFLARPRAGDHPDTSSFTRVVTSVEGRRAWRRLPLPVADRLYSAVRPPAVAPRTLFVGEDRGERDDFLVPLKHDFDLVHAVGGLSVADLEHLMARTDAGLVLIERPESAASPNMAFVHLAAGQLLIADGAPAQHGLRPGIDFIQVKTGWQAWRVLDTMRSLPDAFRSIRLTGHRAAEAYRASRFWPHLTSDVLADVRAFG